MAKQLGWIKLHRRVMDSDAYLTEPFCRNMAWIDLLLLANHKPGFMRVRGLRIEINRGQVGYSMVTLAARWKWSRGKVERFLDELEAEQQIEQQKNRVTTLISILNYETYQGDEATNEATDRATDGQQTGINKNVKNEKKISNTKGSRKKISYTVQWPLGFDENFTRLWQAYKEYRIAEGKGWFRNGMTEQTAINNFWEHCGGDLATAEQIIKITIGNKWTGLFPLKTNNQNGNKQLFTNQQSPASSSGKATNTLGGIATITEF